MADQEEYDPREKKYRSDFDPNDTSFSSDLSLHGRPPASDYRPESTTRPQSPERMSDVLDARTRSVRDGALDSDGNRVSADSRRQQGTNVAFDEMNRRKTESAANPDDYNSTQNREARRRRNQANIAAQAQAAQRSQSRWKETPIGDSQTSAEAARNPRPTPKNPMQAAALRAERGHGTGTLGAGTGTFATKYGEISVDHGLPTINNAPAGRRDAPPRGSHMAGGKSKPDPAPAPAPSKPAPKPAPKPSPKPNAGRISYSPDTAPPAGMIRSSAPAKPSAPAAPAPAPAKAQKQDPKRAPYKPTYGRRGPTAEQARTNREKVKKRIKDWAKKTYLVST